MFTVVKKDPNFVDKFGISFIGATTYLCDICDAQSEEEVIDKLPVAVGEIAIGSSAYFIESGNAYILGPSRQWLKYGGVSMVR